MRRQCRESQKEKELLEKKLERTEKARAQEVPNLLHPIMRPTAPLFMNILP